MKAIDAQMFLSMLRGGAVRLEAEKERVNALNVFPVPDGDTGTNMALTMQSALRSAEQSGSGHLGEMAEAAARGALLGARGNSGVILSQFFRGLADGLAGLFEADTHEIVRALESAAKAAYKAVLEPVEGTMLSVGRAGAEAAREAAERGFELSRVLIAAFEGASKMLSETPLFLEALRDAGVVDAGGEGLVVAAFGSLGVLQNGAVAALAQAAPAVSYAGTSAPVRATPTLIADAHHGISLADITYKFCTEFLIHGEGLDTDVIKAKLQNLQADSLLVVGDPSLVKVHIHTNEPWLALEVGAAFGELAEVQAGNMVLQNEQAAVRPQRSTPEVKSRHDHAVSKPEIGVVAVVQGAGFERILTDLGVTHFVEGGQSMNPSTQEMLDAIDAAGSARVLLLPNNRNIMLAAEQVASMSDKDVVVIPSQSIPQAIASMIEFDPSRPHEEMVEAMSRAAQGTRVGEITEAVRDARMNGWDITAGQLLSLTGGSIVGVNSSLDEAVVSLIAAMEFEGAEILTLYYGADVTDNDAENLASVLETRYADLEIEVYSGGQPIYHYLVTLE